MKSPALTVGLGAVGYALHMWSTGPLLPSPLPSLWYVAAACLLSEMMVGEEKTPCVKLESSLCLHVASVTGSRGSSCHLGYGFPATMRQAAHLSSLSLSFSFLKWAANLSGRWWVIINCGFFFNCSHNFSIFKCADCNSLSRMEMEYIQSCSVAAVGTDRFPKEINYISLTHQMLRLAWTFEISLFSIISKLKKLWHRKRSDFSKFRNIRCCNKT